MLHAFWADWLQWWDTVPPEFAFLTALPFGVAAAALASDAVRRHVARRHEAAQDAPPPAAATSPKHARRKGGVHPLPRL